MHLKSSVLKRFGCLSGILMLAHMMMCGSPVWTCLECFDLIDPASWRRVSDPDSLWQGRHNRSRYDLLSCVVGKCASDAINDAVGSCKAKNVKGSSQSLLPSIGATQVRFGMRGETVRRRLPTTGQESFWWQFGRTWMLASTSFSASSTRSVSRFSLRRIPRSQLTAQGLHEVSVS